jgi:hypothetical protein
MLILAILGLAFLLTYPIPALILRARRREAKRRAMLYRRNVAAFNRLTTTQKGFVVMRAERARISR